MEEYNHPFQPPINYQSTEWAKIEEWLVGELFEIYKRIASPYMDERETQFYRGQASMLAKMLEFRAQSTS